MADASCAHCHKAAAEAPNLKLCAKCQSTHYCSRQCQKDDWKVHKKVCSNMAGGGFDKSKVEHNTSYKTPHVSNLQKQIPNPFTRLDNNTYLHDRPEQDVYKLLIDSFRLRQEDNFVQEKKKDKNSIYTGAENSSDGFRRFLQVAASRNNLLPPWWNADKQKECEDVGLNGADESSLKRKLYKQEVQDKYGDDKMPMQIRMLAETVYARGPGGADGTAMRRAMMSMEANDGREGNGVMSMMHT